METWRWRNQIDGHAWNDNDWHRRRRLHATREAHTTAKCFLGNSHCSPHLCEFTTAVSQSLTPTNKHLVDVGNTITQTSHGLESYALPQVHICSRFMKLLAMLANLPLVPSWMPVEDHGSRSTQKSIHMQWWQYVPFLEHTIHKGYKDIPIVLLDLAWCTDIQVQCAW